MYLGLIIPSLLLVLGSQVYIHTKYAEYNKISNQENLTGAEAARIILDKNNLEKIYVVETNGTLSDHYDPSRKVIRLSKDVFNKTTISALAIAAHEVGHAIQDKENYTFLKLRSIISPSVNFITNLGYVGLIFAIFANQTMYINILIYTLIATLIFQLVTLPVEFDASKRAIQQLEKLELIKPNENQKVKSVLNAAAFTYVAALASNLLDLARLLLIARDNNE